VSLLCKENREHGVRARRRLVHVRCCYSPNGNKQMVDIEICYVTIKVFKENSTDLVLIDQHGKEKSPSDGHCQSQKEMEVHLLACQQCFDRKPHSDPPC
jgi:hypothetical protein